MNAPSNAVAWLSTAGMRAEAVHEAIHALGLVYGIELALEVHEEESGFYVVPAE